MKQETSKASASAANKSGKAKSKLPKHPFVIPVLMFLLLFVATAVGFVLVGSETVGPADKRVVQVYNDGDAQTVPTRAKTVGELLQRLEIDVSKEDIVEPKLATEIDSDNFSVNVYRARPVIVVDDKKKSEQAIITAHQEPRAIAKQAGIKLFPEDSAVVAPPSDVVEDGLEERIVIKRSTQVELNLYGKSYKVRTHALTVRELLEEREVVYQEESVLPALDTKLRQNEIIYVTSPNKKIRRVEKNIPQKENTQQDPGLDIGEERVVEAGRPGRKVVIFSVDKKGRRKVLQEVVVVKPVDRLIAVGTKVPTVAIAGNKAGILSSAGVPRSQHFAADFIIAHESGWELTAQNPSGCLGLGQACPGDKLVAACPSWQTDAVCQIQFFSGYAEGRYGSWSGAYQAWQLQGWW